jgi:hypothetical protein
MIRPRRSASPRDCGEARRSKPRKDRRRAANTVSRSSNARVADAITSGKWFVSLTGEVPSRPRSHHCVLVSPSISL